MVNYHLKAVATLAGIAKKLVTHTARNADRGRQLGVAAADMHDLVYHHNISQAEECFGEWERSELSQKGIATDARKYCMQPARGNGDD